MPDRNIRGRDNKARSSKAGSSRTSTNGMRRASPKTQAEVGGATRVPGHSEHHRMIARNLNGLLENVTELRSNLLADRKAIKGDVRGLDGKLFKIQNELETLARSHAKLLEDMTSVAFDTNLQVKGGLNSIDAIWDVLAEIVPEHASAISKSRREAEEREKRRIAAIDTKLAELAESAKRSS